MAWCSRLAMSHYMSQCGTRSMSPYSVPRPAWVYTVMIYNDIYWFVNYWCFLYTLWWFHDKEMFSTLLALCEENKPFTDGFPSQRVSYVELWICGDIGWTSCWTNTALSMTLDTMVLIWHHCNYNTAYFWYLVISSQKVLTIDNP